MTHEQTWSYQSVSSERTGRWVKGWPTRDNVTAHSMEVKLIIGYNLARNQTFPYSLKIQATHKVLFFLKFHIISQWGIASSPVSWPFLYSSDRLLIKMQFLNLLRECWVLISSGRYTLSFLGFKYHMSAVSYSSTLERICVSS